MVDPEELLRRDPPAPPRAPVPRRRATQSHGPFHFSVGKALGRALGFFGKKFVFVAIASLLLYSPLLLVKLQAASAEWESQRWLGYEMEGASIHEVFWTFVAKREGVLARLLERGAPFILQAIITLAVFQFLRGRSVQPMRSVNQGLGRVLTVIGVAFFTGLILALVGFVGGLVILTVTNMVGELGIIVGIALLAVVLVVLCVFWVAVQAAVVERVGPSAAMSRSAWLTRGARWKIFGLLMLIGVLAFTADAVLTHVVVGQLTSWAEVRSAVIATVVLMALFSGFQAVAAAVVYHDLRHAKEGVDVDDLLKVFD